MKYLGQYLRIVVIQMICLYRISPILLIAQLAIVVLLLTLTDWYWYVFLLTFIGSAAAYCGSSTIREFTIIFIDGLEELSNG